MRRKTGGQTVRWYVAFQIEGLFVAFFFFVVTASVICTSLCSFAGPAASTRDKSLTYVSSDTRVF